LLHRRETERSTPESKMTTIAPQAVAGLPIAERRVRGSSSRPARGEALRRLRSQRIITYIYQNLADPDLCAAGAARALGLSVRSLHLALAPEGESFNLLVQRRRLAACLALLHRPDRGDRIADIAFACGFNSLSSFYRAFRGCFGACPRSLDSRSDAREASIDARQVTAASLGQAAF
jgi:AraC-like DNA-binding protein